VPKTSTKVGESPRLNEVVEKSVGEAVYETYNYREFEGVKLTEPADVDVLAARWSLPPQESLQVYLEGPAKIYCTREPVLLVMGKMTSRVCLGDLDNKQSHSIRGQQQDPVSTSFGTGFVTSFWQ